VIGAVAAGALAISACDGSDDAFNESHLTLIERPISIYVEDNAPKGPSVGDVRTFHQELLFSNGDHAGTFDGSTTNSAEQGHGAAGLESRIGVIQYSLSGGTILAGGLYSAAPGVVVPKGGVTRALIGGTGKYLGATGQVVQTPLSNGNIKNEITLLLP
jgi:hypothetical protein